MRKGNQQNHTELCLCPRCAQQFYNSSRRRIVRADPIQVIMDMCDCCRTRRGYDFILAVPIRIQRPECKVMQ